VYAPALVAFVGGGGFGVSLSIGGGEGFAWFALGPRDVFVPSYHVSATYVQNINISNTTVINRTQIVNVYNNYQVTHVTNVTYVNQSAPGAVMAVSRDTFVNARPVQAAAIKISPQEIQHPQVMKTAAPLAPTPAARIGPNAPAKESARPPAALATHSVVTKRAPSPRAAPLGKPAPVKAGSSRPPAPMPTRSVPAPQPAAKPAAPPAPGKPVPAAREQRNQPPSAPPAHSESAKPATPAPAPPKAAPPKPAPKPEAKPANPPPAERQAQHPAPEAKPKAPPPPDKNPDKKEKKKKEPDDEKPKPE
jgi:hypothetical protein